MSLRPVALAAAVSLGLGLLVSAPSAGATSTPSEGSAPGSTAPQAVAAGLIVEYAPGTPAREAPGVPTGASSVTATDLEMGRGIADGLRTVDFTEPEPAEIAERAAAQLERDPDVLRAEPNWVITLDSIEPQATPRAVQASPPWGLDRIDQRVGLDSSYTYATTGAGVDVYVIDSGIRSTHVDFGGRVTAGANFYPGFADASDCWGHGTHVAGTIGGSTYGVAKGVTLIPVRVFGCSGETLTSTVINGLDWVRSQHSGARPSVVNMSLGGDANFFLDNAVSATIAAGITVVVASGNDSRDACLDSPGRVSDAITVNSATNADAPSSFTNFGACADLYAPGSSIRSAWYSGDTASAFLSGTSMAAPHVAGAAARILQRYPSYTPAQVWDAINAATSPVTFNAGAGDPSKLLYVSPTDAPPGPPESLSVTGAVQALNLTWAAPTTGAAAASYAVEFSDDSATWTSAGSVVTTSATISSSVTVGTPYWVRVRSVTGDDSSAWVTAGPATPLAPPPSGGGGGGGTPPPPAVTLSAPGAPTVESTIPGDRTITASWSPSDDTGGAALTGFIVELEGGGSTVIRETSSTSTDFTDLVNGTPYRLRVAASHSLTGDWSAWSEPITPRGPAEAPTNLTATATSDSAKLTWSAPASDGGSPITGYSIEVSTGASTKQLTASTTSTTILGLASATAYAVRVAALTEAGPGAWSTSATFTTQSARLTAPTAVKATRSGQRVTIRWKPPKQGDAVRYRVAVSIGGKRFTPVTTTSRTTYSFTTRASAAVRIAAIDRNGRGPWSSPLTIRRAR